MIYIICDWLYSFLKIIKASYFFLYLNEIPEIPDIIEGKTLKGPRLYRRVWVRIGFCEILSTGKHQYLSIAEQLMTNNFILSYRSMSPSRMAYFTRSA